MARRTSRKGKSEGTLAERAMIIRRCVTRWTGFVMDRSIASEYAASKKADRDMFATGKMLVRKDTMRAIRQAISQGDRLHKQRTLPWNDGGYRILSSEAYFDYMSEQRDCRSRFEQAVETFLSRWDEHVAEGKLRLGKAADNYEYPTLDQVRQRFTYTVQPLPLPTADDFRVALDATELNVVRAGIEAEQREAIRIAMQEPYQRLATLVAHMVERLEAYVPPSNDNKAENGFRNSLVENIRELVGLMPQLNITRDPELDALVDEAKDRLLIDPEMLRGNARVRKQTADEASKILAKLNAFI